MPGKSRSKMGPLDSIQTRYVICAIVSQLRPLRTLNMAKVGGGEIGLDDIVKAVLVARIAAQDPSFLRSDLHANGVDQLSRVSPFGYAQNSYLLICFQGWTDCYANQSTLI